MDPDHLSSCANQKAGQPRGSSRQTALTSTESLRADPTLLTPQERLTAFGELMLRAMERRKRQLAVNKLPAANQKRNSCHSGAQAGRT
jgi:hypothetical protein